MLLKHRAKAAHVETQQIEQVDHKNKFEIEIRHYAIGQQTITNGEIATKQNTGYAASK